MITIKEASLFCRDGDWIESKDQSSSGIRLIQTGNIGVGVYLDKFSRAKYISEETFNKLECTEVFPGDIIVSRLPAPVGRACIVPDGLGRTIAAVDCTILRIDKKKFLKEYVLLYTETGQYKSQIEKFLAGSTRVRISRKNLESISIPQKNLETQKSIVSRIYNIKNIIELRKQQLFKLDQLVKSRFVEMFGDENSFHSWVTCKVDNIAEVCVGIVIKPSQYYTLDIESGIKAFRSLNIGEMYIKNKDWVYFTKEGHQKNQKSIIKENDVLIVRSGSPGTACVATKEYAGYNAIDIIIAHPNCKKINPVFLAMFTNMPHGMNQIRENTGGAAQQHFNVGGYKNITIILPPLFLQEQFAAFVQQVEKAKSSVNLSLEKLETLKKSLMQEYFG